MVCILQFTDLHFRKALPGHSGHVERLSRHGPTLLEALAARIADEDPDLVVFTGDIIDAPHDLLHGTAEEEYAAFLREAVRSDYRTMRSWLDSLKRPWMIAPGNHDYRPVFEEVFADAPRRFSLSPIDVHAYFDWEVRENTAERLAAERKRFEHALAGADRDGWTVHLQHFLIWPRVQHGYPMRYREADELRDLLAADAGRHLVLCGHFHEGTLPVDLGRARFAVCPSLTEAPHRYRVFSFSDGDCRFREEALLPGPLAGRRLLLIDRSSFLTMSENAEDGSFSLRPGAGSVLSAVRQAGFEPVLLSTWNDSQSVHLSWSEILKKHDHLFFSLADDDGESGSGLVIALDAQQPLPPRLPSEPILRLDGIIQSAAIRFGVTEDMIWILSRQPAHCTPFPADRTYGSLAQLSMIDRKEGV